MFIAVCTAHGFTMAGGRVRYHVRDILREFFRHNFVFGIHTLKSKKTTKPKNFFFKILGFSSPDFVPAVLYQFLQHPAYFPVFWFLSRSVQTLSF